MLRCVRWGRRRRPGRTKRVLQHLAAPAGPSTWHAVGHPPTVRVLLRFGADPSMTYDGTTPEEHANRQMFYYDACRESVRLLRDARLLRPRLRQIFALRALCHRGRAAPTSATPSAFARLIGSAPASKPRTRAAAKIRSSPGLPDPLAHLVCKFWLGSPPRRAKRAATRASE